MADEEKIKAVEKDLSYVQERKESCVKRQRFEEACEFREEENKLFAELEKLTSAEHLKREWKVINDNAGHYFTPQYLK